MVPGACHTKKNRGADARVAAIPKIWQAAENNNWPGGTKAEKSLFPPSAKPARSGRVSIARSIVGGLFAICLGALVPVAPPALAMGGDGNAWHQLDAPGGYPGAYGPFSRGNYDGWNAGAPSALGPLALDAGIAGSGVAPYFNGCFEVRPRLDRLGHYVGQRWVYVCH